MSYFDEKLNDKTLIREKLLSLAKDKGLSHIKELLEDYGTEKDINTKLEELYKRMQDEIEDFIFSDKRLLAVLNSLDSDTHFDFEDSLSQINREDLVDKINYPVLFLMTLQDLAIRKFKR